MSQLFKKENKTLIADLIPAQSWRQRIQGLTLYAEIKERQAFWISACPSIHTFFMTFPIDVIFTDSRLQIVSLFSNVKAGKILFGGFKSRNVFEMKAGQIESCRLKKGDLLHVES